VAAVPEVAGHRLYRLPKHYGDRDWGVYDGTTNILYHEVEELVTALELDLEDEAVEALVEKLPIARAASREVRPRRPNAYNNAGYVVHLVYDPVARHGQIFVQSLVTSDADIEADNRTGLTWQQLVREGMAIGREAQDNADG